MTLKLNLGQFGNLALTKVLSLTSRSQWSPRSLKLCDDFLNLSRFSSHMLPVFRTCPPFFPHPCTFKIPRSLSQARVVFDVSDVGNLICFALFTFAILHPATILNF